ncbi:MAG: selenocysteine-specific translation elongation factor [Pyrinomonadaceae bacterium]
MNIIIGTAGHIDHGKTSLVRALTGVDADRLPEEKKRGITIDLGFAELAEGKRRIGFVDVPGHERFVKNMLAGASGIDAVVLVVAADEGVMPQTREHFDICRLLGIKNGIIAITKTDLAEEEFTELVESEVEELVAGSFLEGAPVLRFSAKDETGADEIREALFALIKKLEARSKAISIRLPIDRCFSVKGFGAVITGTLASGEIANGAELELMPERRTVRVRGVQTHGREAERAYAGQRTALNLGGIDHSEITRGMVLAEPGAFAETQVLDCEVEVLKTSERPLRSRQRVRAHFGTVEVLARIDVLNEERRIEPGEKGYVQIRTETAVTGVPGERFILRQYSPQITVAGGVVLDALARKRKRAERDARLGVLETLSEKGPHSLDGLVLFVEAESVGGIESSELRKRTGLKQHELAKLVSNAKAAKSISEAGSWLISNTSLGELKQRLIDMVLAHHKAEPLAPGLARGTLQEKAGRGIPNEIFRLALEELAADGTLKLLGENVAHQEHKGALSAEEETVKDRIFNLYVSSYPQLPGLSEALESSISGTGVDAKSARRILQLLISDGKMVKVSEDFFVPKDSLDKLIAEVRNFAETKAENRLIGVPEFKEIAGVSRKYAIPFLEYLDGIGVTRRAGEKRIVMR